ncbi:MAG: sarcosine oxidase subunit gamma [Pseudomonadota bacterium]
MVKLIARSPCEGLLPYEAGGIDLIEVPPLCITSISPYRGQLSKLSAALKSAHGAAFPAPNRTTGKEGARVIWSGIDQAFLIGDAPADRRLAEYAALTDQSDAWAVVRLQGGAAANVMARLSPLDFNSAIFKSGYTARTELHHMMAVITRVGLAAFEIMVMRSFAATLVHDLKTAMKSVAAQERLEGQAAARR